MFDFSVVATSGFARAGTFTTPHWVIETPMFMPVGTQAAVKGLAREELLSIGTQIALANTYHLYLRPSDTLIAEMGGLHRFMNVEYPLLTDSGGFQVFSLGQTGSSGFKNKENLVKITEDGVQFRSHLDGSKHMFTPERAMEIQANLGADIIMAFDECAPGNSTHQYASAAMGRTHRWAERSLARHNELQVERVAKWLHPQALFPIAQGVIYEDLRKESVQFVSALEAPGVAIGGLSVGESKADMLRILDAIAPELPVAKPHYLMGLGTPEDIIEGVYHGIDLFDCVLPTRLGRHGVAYTSFGDIKVTNEKYRSESAGIPMLPGFETQVSKTYSLSYLRHLLKVGEILGGRLLSLHNLEYLILLAKHSRQAIIDGRFETFRAEFWSQYKSKRG